MLGPGAGSKVYIGTTAVCTTVTEYEADTWTEVGQIESIPDHGDQANDITANPLDQRRTLHFSGNFDAGQFSLSCYDDSEDTGQQAMISAFASQLQTNFKIVLDDKLTNSGTGTTEYFAGRVQGKRRNPGSSTAMRMRTFPIGINTEILEAPAS